MAAHVVTADDQARAISLLHDLQSKVKEVSSHVAKIQEQVQDGDIKTAKGVSFLEVKYQMLLSYLVNLSHLMCLKTHGQSIKEEGTVSRLVEIRTVLEKMRPIDQKLKYQIDKLIKTATTGAIAENDPLRLKPNPDNLESKLDDESESGSESDTEKDKSGVYKPPKISAIRMDGDETEQERKDRLMEKRKKKALSSSIMRDLKAEYYDGPEEIRDTPDMHRAKADKAGKEREEYEEKYFMRMQVSKKELNAAKRVRTMGDLNSITHFSDISALHGDNVEDEDGMPRKKRKVASTKGKKKGKGKKRKFRK